MLLVELARTSADVAALPGRSAKAARLAKLLGEAPAAEAALVIGYLAGDLRQRRTGIGYASLRDLPRPAEVPTLTVSQADEQLQLMSQLSGLGSVADRQRGLDELMARATAPEQQLLIALLSGELHQGASAGVMLDALARASGVPAEELRTARMLAGSLPALAGVLADGARALEGIRLELGRPIQPMLAKSAPDLAAAIERIGPVVAVEWKLDGIRLQVHLFGGAVRVFTRSLDDVTQRMPEVVAAVSALDVSSIVLDGEAISLTREGRPRPFQETASRAGRVTQAGVAQEAAALTFLAFDLLHLDGADLLAEVGRTRADLLTRTVPVSMRIPRLVTEDPAQAAAFAAASLASGHEGVVVKALDAPYLAGRRGEGWIKVKPRHTLDLVVLAAEWGHGRRTGWLSNLHLGARDPAGEHGPAGGFVMLGKTFKGMTDAMLAAQTSGLLALALTPGSTDPHDTWVVPVRPEFVVEVAFDGVQTSPRYPAGMALRFARVLRHRPDKTASQADTVADVRAVHQPAR